MGDLEKFIEHVRTGMNRTEAAVRAGFGSNYNSSKAMGYQLSRRPDVAERTGRPLAKAGGTHGKAAVKRLAKGVAEGLTLPEAAREAGYQGTNDNSLHASASRALGAPGNLRVIKDVLTKHGLDDDCGARVLTEGLLAMRQVVVYQGKDGPATVVEYPDHIARKMYLDILFRLRGHYRDTGEGSAGNIIFQISESLRGALPPTGSVDAKFEEIKKGGE